MIGRLLSSRRFAPLFVTQFLGAFNDNLLKSALAIFVTYRLAAAGGTDAATLVMLAGAIFIAPFFLFSGASGTLADRVDKAAIARWVKIAEVLIMAIGAAGFATASVPLLLIALFGLVLWQSDRIVAGGSIVGFPIALGGLLASFFAPQFYARRHRTPPPAPTRGRWGRRR